MQVAPWQQVVQRSGHRDLAGLQSSCSRGALRSCLAEKGTRQKPAKTKTTSSAKTDTSPSYVQISYILMILMYKMIVCHQTFQPPKPFSSKQASSWTGDWTKGLVRSLQKAAGSNGGGAWSRVGSDFKQAQGHQNWGRSMGFSADYWCFFHWHAFDGDQFLCRHVWSFAKHINHRGISMNILSLCQYSKFFNIHWSTWNLKKTDLSFFSHGCAAQAFELFRHPCYPEGRLLTSERDCRVTCSALFCCATSMMNE